MRDDVKKNLRTGQHVNLLLRNYVCTIFKCMVKRIRDYSVQSGSMVIIGKIHGMHWRGNSDAMEGKSQ